MPCVVLAVVVVMEMAVAMEVRAEEKTFCFGTSAHAASWFLSDLDRQ